MSNFAYTDEKRQNCVYANQASQFDKDKRFYCPNPDCDAYLYICSVDGLKNAYFSADQKGHGHIEGCFYAKQNSFNPNKYDESVFDFENLINNLMQNNQENSSKTSKTSNKKSDTVKPCSIRTIRQLYDICKSKPVDSYYNNIQIRNMLLDNRSISSYTKGIWKNKLVEATLKPSFYDKNLHEFYLSVGEYKLILKLDGNDELFRYIRDTFFHNQDKLIVIAGYWEKGDNYNEFKTNIKTKKQIMVLR